MHLRYFQKVVETFEQRMREYRLHISNLEEYVRSSFQPTSYTPKSYTAPFLQY